MGCKTLNLMRLWAGAVQLWGRESDGRPLARDEALGERVGEWF